MVAISEKPIISFCRHFADYVGKYAEKGIQTEPKILGELKTFKLKYGNLSEDIIDFSKKPNISITPKNTIKLNSLNIAKDKYVSNQQKDIATYGEKIIERIGVSDEILEKFTPYRRLSNKPAILSNTSKSIEKFEQNIHDIPANWNSLTLEEKADFIVKDRYAKMITNKIMNSIKDEPIEHFYGLTRQGDINYYQKSTICGGDMSDISLLENSIAIHNHPIKENYLKNDRKKWAVENSKNGEEIFSKFPSPHSTTDIQTSLHHNIHSYVIDSNGNKFVFKPSPEYVNMDAIERFSNAQQEIPYLKALDKTIEPDENVVANFKAKHENFKLTLKGNDDIKKADANEELATAALGYDLNWYEKLLQMRFLLNDIGHSFAKI